jgi:hypothetical protein
MDSRRHCGLTEKEDNRFSSVRRRPWGDIESRAKRRGARLLIELGFRKSETRTDEYESGLAAELWTDCINQGGTTQSDGQYFGGARALIRSSRRRNSLRNLLTSRDGALSKCCFLKRQPIAEWRLSPVSVFASFWRVSPKTS